MLVQKLAWTLDDKKHDYGKVEVVVVPPFTDIRSVQTLVDGDRLPLRYGAQDVSEHDGGAYTGEISAAMLAKLGCSYVVVGHSERREHHGETDELVNAKAHKALARRHDADRVRRRGPRGPPGRRARAHTLAQVRGLAGRVHAPSRSPGWWSPTSRSGRSAPARSPPPTTRRRSARRSAGRCARPTATPPRTAYASSTAARSRRPTWPAIMAEADVDGCLVGGASLQADEFGGICRYYDMPVL